MQIDLDDKVIVYGHSCVQEYENSGGSEGYAVFQNNF